MSDPFMGEIRMLGFNYAPRDWAFCNGQLLPIQQNSALFALLGTFYGGDGHNTFALPNLQGRVPMHFGQSPGTSHYFQGQAGGTESVNLTLSQLPTHNHTATVTGGAMMTASTSAGTLRTPAEGSMLAASGQRDLQFIDAANAGTPVNLGPSTTTNVTVQSAGNSSPLSIMQPYLAINFCIATQGIYPSRN
ncbi:MAG: tail fiber protein [Comamonas sp.]